MRWRASGGRLDPGVDRVHRVRAAGELVEQSSGRASASVTLTLSSARPISSAIVIAAAVVIPCPTSARGSANDTVPSGLTLTVIRFDVGIAASVSRSLRSYSSTGWTVGSAAPARPGAARARRPDQSRRSDQVADEPATGDAVRPRPAAISRTSATRRSVSAAEATVKVPAGAPGTCTSPEKETMSACPAATRRPGGVIAPTAIGM